MTKRSVPIACLRFLALPIRAHHPNVDPSASQVVHEGGTVVFCNASARARGIRPGRSVSVARTHDAALIAQPLDRRALRRAHQDVLATLTELSPRVSESRLGVVWAEPFGAGWAERVVDAFDQPVRVGLGPDATTAYAAACCTRSILRVQSDEARGFLDRSPVAVLELSARGRRGLAALGIRRVGELRAFDPTSLAMRLGPEVAEAWHRAEGNDPRGPRFGPASDPDEARLELDDPVADRAALLRVIEPMVRGLAARARDRDRGIVELYVRLDAVGVDAASRRTKDSHTRARNRHEQGAELVTRLGAPTIDGDALMRGLTQTLERARLEVRRVRIRARTVPLPRATEPLLGPSAAGLQRALLERLAERMPVRRATQCDATDPIASARWLDDPAAEPAAGAPWPWRTTSASAVVDGVVWVAGASRRVVKVGKHHRVSSAWWDGAFPATQVCAWAELEGPVLALLRETSSGWEVVGWLD